MKAWLREIDYKNVKHFILSFCVIASVSFTSIHASNVKVDHTNTTVAKKAQNKSNRHSQAISADVAIRVAPFLLPNNHPIKAKLDHIFKKSRAIANLKALQKAGFKKAKPQPWTHVVVTSHKKIKGYIFKLYLDDQRYHKGIPEHEFWIRRATGAKLIREEIDKHGWQPFFKVPQKWIYALPANPKAKKNSVAKNFILVEEDMDILSDAEGKAIWQSGFMTTTHLDMLFTIISAVGLFDCCKPSNIPFSKDGRIAFVDTQSYHRWPIDGRRLLYSLPPNLTDHWNKILFDYITNYTTAPMNP